MPISRHKAKKVVEKTANTTVKVTHHVINWIFFVFAVYISITMLWGYVNTDNFLENIITLSVGGFWAFLFGYFGWRFGQGIEKYFMRRH